MDLEKLKLLSILLITISVSCSACTTISITESSGNVIVERSFGFAKISPVADTSVITAKATSFGYISSPLGYSIGYSKQTVTTANDDCRIIVWVDEKIDSEEFLTELKKIENVCVSK
jgi:hypothetical protein